MQADRGPRRGLTLIELLVVLSIVGILTSLLLVGLSASREASRRAACGNHLRQIGLALNAYQGGLGTYPPAYVSGIEDRITETGPCWAWGAMILPQLEQAPVYNSINFSTAISEPSARTSRSVSIAAYLCPSSTRSGPVAIRDLSSRIDIVPDLGPAQYVASAGSRNDSRSPVDSTHTVSTKSGMFDGVIYRNSAIRPSDVVDGASQTFLIGERYRGYSDAAWPGTLPIGRGVVCSRLGEEGGDCVFTNVLVIGHTGHVSKRGIADTPNNVASSVDGFSSGHSHGCLFLFCDGSARFVGDAISPAAYRALSTRSRGEVVDGGGY